jgi:hypothetical protein
VHWIPDAEAFPAVSEVILSPTFIPDGTAVIPSDSSTSTLGSPRHLTPAQLAEFKKTLPSAVQVQLDQPFGKDSLSHSFTSELRFSHVLVFLYDAKWLDRRSQSTLEFAMPEARAFAKLRRDYSRIDFRSIVDWSWYKNYDTEVTLNQDRLRLTTAALLHYKFDVATLVRYLGGPHTGAHRPVDRILETIKQSVNSTTRAQLERILRVGSPTHMNSDSTSANFYRYLQHGNHKSALDNPDKMESVFVKDCRRGHALALDLRVLPFVPHLHLTPLGLVDVDDPWKKPRPVFDSSYRAHWDSFAINDWAVLEEEPELRFPGSFLRFLIYLWNLRASFPEEEIFLGDNDISGAFRLVKYHPELVSLHGYTVNDRYLGFATGGTFGDSPSPANFEPFAVARQEHAE